MQEVIDFLAKFVIDEEFAGKSERVIGVCFKVHEDSQRRIGTQIMVIEFL